MNADYADFRHTEITRQIIGAAYEVQNTLGAGFAEKVYENTLAAELAARGIAVRRQAPVQVFYEEKLVGDYIADLIVEDKVIVELKATRTMDRAFEAQLINYLKATGIEVGLVLNFSDNVEVKRLVFSRSSSAKSASICGEK